MWYMFHGRGDINLSASKEDASSPFPTLEETQRRTGFDSITCIPLWMSIIREKDAIVFSYSVACVVEQGDQQLHQIRMVGIPNKMEMIFP